MSTEMGLRWRESRNALAFHEMELRNAIFGLHTRRFGTVAEIMVKKIIGIENSNKLNYDLFDKVNNMVVSVDTYNEGKHFLNFKNYRQLKNDSLVISNLK